MSCYSILTVMNKRIVLVRHGQSTWNLENRFTGWTDVPLTQQGIQEAQKGGKTLTENGIKPTIVFTSLLKRAIKTMNLMLEEMDLLWLPVHKTWRLNEKHYGTLQGLNKAETAAQYGNDQVKIWRRSFDVAPPALSPTDERSASNDSRYAGIENIPQTESLKDTIERTLPFWENTILPELKNHNDILVVAHGNSLRGIIKVVKSMSDEDILELNLPTAVPLVLEFDANGKFVKDYFLGDAKEIKKLMEAVANQGKNK